MKNQALTLEKADSLHARFVKHASRLQPFVLLFMRLTIAWELAESGIGHLSDVAGTAENFRKWGIPLPVLNVYISGSTELIGGTLLMLGLCARLIAIPLVFNFLVAYATATRIHLAEMIAKGAKPLALYDALIDDSAFTMIVLALVMLAFGPGKISVDYLIRRAVSRKEDALRS